MLGNNADAHISSLGYLRFDLLTTAERREFDDSDCCWGGELDGIKKGLKHIVSI